MALSLRRSAFLALVISGAFALGGPVACGDDEATSQLRAELPAAPQSLADGIIAADAAWRAALEEWRSAGRPAPVPEEVTLPASYLQRAARVLARDRRLTGETLRNLPRGLAKQVRDIRRATRNLQRLSAGWPAHEIKTGPPTSLDVLLPAYREAKRRFDVGFHVLAAVNHVESAFGRARNDSVAGAQGPMQFIPSTWEIYGLGGDIRDPHDAILGAANYLDQSGAPQNYGLALYHYNPSQLYVEAVLRYARLIRRDHDNFFLLYSWEP